MDRELVVTTKLSPVPLGTGRRVTLPRAIGLGYLTAWTALLLWAGACAVSGRFAHTAAGLLGVPVRHTMKAPPATALHALELFAGNLFAAAGPIVCVLIGITGWRGYRLLIGTAVIYIALGHVLPVATVLGIYGTRWLPYAPQLPLELFAMTIGPAIYLCACRNTVSRWEMLTVVAVMAGVLGVAAVLETWAVPH